MDADMSAKHALTGGKEAHRRRLADLPYPEKVRIVVELQKIAAPILKARGVTVSPWRLDEGKNAQRSTLNAQVGREGTLNVQRSTLNVQVGRSANDCQIPRGLLES
jgi:hypothetical protein